MWLGGGKEEREIGQRSGQVKIIPGRGGRVTATHIRVHFTNSEVMFESEREEIQTDEQTNI